MGVLSARGKRSFTYSFIILAVISIFVLGYLFYFIPNNKKTVQNNGFLILQTIATNISNATDGRVTFYANIFESAIERTGNVREKAIDTLLRENKVDAKFKFFRKPAKNKNDSIETESRIQDARLIVSVWNKSRTDSAVFIEKIDNFLEPFISTQKSELFNSYLFGKLGPGKSELIYKDDEISLRSDVGLDSLMPKLGEDYLAGTRDLELQDASVKMFYYPFQVNEVQYIICGFVDSDSYQASIRKIPFSFVYPLAIIFLLLLISLPVLKFYIMDSNEQIRMKDVLFFGISVFLSAAFITLTIIQFLLWKGEERRVEQNLVNIAEQIRNQFCSELQTAYEKMEELNKAIRVDAPTRNQKDSLHADASVQIRKYLRGHNTDPSKYYHFDRISWIDDKGEQRVKAELHSKPVYTNVQTRKYFKVFQQGIPFYLPGDHSKRFGWEPLNSWTNGDFNITISMRDSVYTTALATKMHSLLGVILPVGYGYCIIDEQGNVQVHSDQNKNLRENFFRKVAPPEKLKGSVASRQFRVVNDVIAYGKLQMMAVQPLQPNMPFHIITFYDKGHIVPVNMRILIFSLLLCALFFVTCAILWRMIGWRNPKNNPLLFCAMDFVSWITPRSKEGTYYFHGSIFMVVYFFATMGYVALKNPYTLDNFNILALLIVTPINIVLGLYCIRAAFILPLGSRTWHELENKRYESLIFAGVHLLISVLIIVAIPAQFSIGSFFFIFQLALNAIMWIYALSSGSSKLVTYRSHRSFLFGYKFLITALVVCLAVLPSALFTWYAHNQELLQTAKRQQLYLAKAIRDRSFLIHEMKGIDDTTLLPTFYVDSLQFARGIYGTQHEQIMYDTCTTAEDEEKSFQNFYFAIAEKVSIPYYDQQSYAALTDSAYDNSWRWLIANKDSNIHFWYLPNFPTRSFDQRRASKNCLHIISRIPPRFVYLGSGKSVPLILLVILLLVALFKWLGRNTEKIFLTKYIYSPRLHQSTEKTGLIAEYFAGKKVPDEESFRRVYSSERYQDYIVQCDKSKLLEYEEEVVADMQNGKDLYEYVWKNCSEKERYLLFDYAQDGLINYKNTKEIIELLNKGIFIVHNERLRIFSPGFRAFMLNSIDQTQMLELQKKYKESSTWHYVRVPLLIMLFGIAAVLFFTQQGIFDKILLLAGGVSTLLTLVMRFFGGGGAGIGKKE